MELKYNGGDTDFFSAPFDEAGGFSLIKTKKVIYSTSGTKTIIQGSGFSVGAGGLPGTTGTVESITYKQGGKVIGKFTDLGWAMSALLPALIALDSDDYAQANALLSSDALTIKALAASDGFVLPSALELHGGVTLTGSKFSDVVATGSGADKLVGRGGADTLDGGAGNDVVDGGGGSDELMGGSGNDKVNGRAGNDLIYGGEGDDVLNGDGGRDEVSGHDGDDTIKGGGGADSLYGDGGNDKISAGGGSDLVYGGIGDDEIDGDGGKDSIEGGDGNDIIRGGAGNDRIDGEDGNDILGGNSGADTIYGGVGNDFIVGGSGRDILYGGTGADQFIFNAASDSGKGAFADVIADFEQGIDFIDLSAFGLTFVGDGKFSGTGAELLVKNDGPKSQIILDLDGDGKGDMRVDVSGVNDLTEDSFVLVADSPEIA